MSDDTIYTIVWTDGLGTYQARDLSGIWRGPWHRCEAKATQDAKDRGLTLSQAGTTLVS
jgi:hypothetical protein